MFDRLLSKEYYFSFLLMLLFIISLIYMYYSVYLYKDSFTRYSYLNDVLLAILKFCFIYSFFFNLSEKKNIFSAPNFVIKKII